MAALGLLIPFNGNARTTVCTTMVMVPTFMSWLRKSPCARPVHCICSHQQSREIDMSVYREKFAQRMEMAGVKPHHRIAIAVSGGPDSVALSILTADWKSGNFDASTNARNNPVNGLLAIVVDHGLRTESAEEADLVSGRIMDMGIECEVVRCEWLDGRPKVGHLQEAARFKRYAAIQNICLQQKIGLLLIAHHADDQAELFILRLSRNSGVLGLAGMAFIAQMFSEDLDFSGGGSKACGVLLVRPLLDFSKDDMYNICRGRSQEWVDDPTNRSPLFARNRIRMSLNNLSSCRDSINEVVGIYTSNDAMHFRSQWKQSLCIITRVRLRTSDPSDSNLVENILAIKTELREVISACRETRLHVDKVCRMLLKCTVAIMPHGYAVVDLGALCPIKVKDIYLAKYATLLLQFISQRQRPVRGKALKLLLGYLRTYPCKTCLTVAGCYICPAPGSKGTMVLVCCSIDPSSPLMLKLFPSYTHGMKSLSDTSDLEQTITDSEAYLDRFTPDASCTPFLDVASPESVLTESRRLGILSISTHQIIVSLQKEESEKFKSKAESISDSVFNYDMAPCRSSLSKLISPGQAGYFMNRFVLYWKSQKTVPCHEFYMEESASSNNLDAEKYSCSCSIVGGQVSAEVRHMIDADWMYISDLAKKNMADSRSQNMHAVGADPPPEKTMNYAVLSARKALTSLKSIPVAARRALPVLVNANEILLSIPSIGFSCCPHLVVSAAFKPIIPLGGGHNSFL